MQSIPTSSGATVSGGTLQITGWEAAWTDIISKMKRLDKSLGKYIMKLKIIFNNMQMSIHSENVLEESWLQSLQESGYRLTAPRRAIVSIVARAPQALDATAIFDLSRKMHPQLGLVTVYRTLEKLEQLDLIQRVHQPGGCNMYLRSPEGHEHLLLCKTCGQVEYFSGDDLSVLINKTAEKSGFQIKEHWLQFFGYCTNCQASPDLEFMK